MSRFRPFASAPAAFGLAALALMGLAGCALGGANASEPTSTASQVPEPSATTPPPSETPIPTPVVPDLADVASWEITAAGIGPIVRGAPYPESIAPLATFEVTEYCPGVIDLSKDATAQILLRLSDDGTEIASVWVSGLAGVDGVVPVAPTTAAGIHLGSSGDELAAAYPELELAGQTASDTYGYAVGDDENGWMDFIVDGDVVWAMGSSERPSAPKEMCG
ncbi:hypothetical protein [Agromyces sp. Marseille-Q5079]|uniref:hypothetical protein n=1 Tax=Agromyces sp. Marseille-Q5079 TaxID=3439059 RepID=UPI003D9CB456